MLITTLLGSPKKKGNTATVLSWIEEELRLRGHTVANIHLNHKSIKGCLGCGKCKEKPDEIACVQKDDATDILRSMISSDVVLFASPIYFWGFSAQLKVLIDRAYSLVTNYHKPGHTSLMKGKRMGLLITGGDDFEDNAEGVFTAFERFSEFLLAEKSGEMYVGGCSSPSELPKDIKTKASKLAQSLVS